MINLKEVAKLSNTSITTVSRVINNSGYVKMETRKRIEETIKTHGYKALERSGGTKAIKTFGLIVPNIENPFYGKIHTKETKRKISKANKGNIPWNKGLKYKIGEKINGIVKI